MRVSTRGNPGTLGKPMVWRLARMAGVSGPDSAESPGAVFLADCWDSAAEIVAGDSRIEDTCDFQSGNGPTPIWTNQQWLVWADLGLWDKRADMLADGLSSGISDADGAVNVAGVVEDRVARELIELLVSDMSDEKVS